MKPALEDARPCQVYLNLEAANSFETPIPLSFSQSFTSALLPKGNDYEGSVIRFCLDGTSLPIMLFPTETFSVTLSLGPALPGGGNSAFQYVVYTLPKAPPPFPEQGIYRYEDFIDLINNALEAAMAALIVKFPALIGKPAPYCIFSTSNQAVSFYFTGDWLTSVPEANRLHCYLNRDLYYNFNNIASTYVAPLIPGASGNFLLTVRDIHGSNSAPLDPAVPPGLYAIRQEFPDPTRMSAGWGASRLTFSSYMLANLPEYTQVANNSPYISNVVGAAGGGAPQVHLITDYQLTGNAFGPAGYRDSLLYLPTAQYRYFDIASTQEVRTVDIRVGWTDQRGNQYPFFLQKGQACSIKLGFFLKDKVCN